MTNSTTRRMPSMINPNTPNKKRPYVPATPGGTPCTWLAAASEKEAWENLLHDAAHMPYRGKEGFVQRGYTVEKWF